MESRFLSWPLLRLHTVQAGASKMPRLPFKRRVLALVVVLKRSECLGIYSNILGSILTIAKAFSHLCPFSRRQLVVDRHSQDRPHNHRGQDWQEASPGLPHPS